MGAIVFKPRLEHIEHFVQMCHEDHTVGRRELFKSVLSLTDDEVDSLLFYGMSPIETDVSGWLMQMKSLTTCGIEKLIKDELRELANRYPSDRSLHVELFPMDQLDTFGREQLGGVSACVNWEGDTMYLIVYPSNEVESVVRSTVVHEYNHHYRMTKLNNGHSNVTLMEKIIREGLAEHFVAEYLGTEFHGPWVASLTEDQARLYWKTLYSNHANDVGDNTDSFVFGGRDTEIPLWAGYSMGYYLVKWYRESHPSMPVMDLTVLGCDDFIPYSANF